MKNKKHLLNSMLSIMPFSNPTQTQEKSYKVSAPGSRKRRKKRKIERYNRRINRNIRKKQKLHRKSSRIR